jgi:ATP-binding cassette subfamily B protein
MAWGGFGPGGAQTSAAAGLPFAGVPEELRARAEVILEREPEHPEPKERYEPRSTDDRPFTLRRFLSAHRMGLALAVVLVVIEALALQIGPLLTQRGIDDGIAKGSTQTLVVIAIIYVISVIVCIVAGSLRVAWTGRLGERLLYDLRIRVFSHLQRLSLDFYTEEKAGRVLTRMTSDIEALQQLFQDGLVNLGVQAFTMVVVTIILFTLQPTMAIITVLAVVPAMAAVTIWFRIASDRAYGVVRDRIADVLSDLSESLSGIRVITAFNRRRNNIYAHRNIVGRYRDANVDTAEINARYGPATDIIGSIGQVVVLGVGGTMVLNGTLSIGELTAFVLYLAAFFAPIQQLVQLYSTYQSGQAAVVKLRDLLATRPTVAEAPDAHPLPPIDGHIVLEHVTFGYGATPVLHDVSLAVAPGETFALVGETGSGKSTIAKLVCRFYDPTAGRILLDGHDLRDITLASLRRQLGVVPQEPFLFAGSLRDNAAFGRPDANDAEVLEACQAVGLDDLLDRLPEGIHSPVHERGTSLSSGERQLLALARAFLARPRVLVLDEATSNLDLKSEGQIERALDAVLDGRTAILIAHRLATAMRADRIAVVHDGEIVELGGHDELVAMGGRYGAMYDTWLSHTGESGRVPLPRVAR